MAKNLRVGDACRSAAIAIGIGALLVPISHAEAAPGFGAPASVALGVEDVTGYYSRSLKYWDRNDRTVELSRSNLSLAFATGGVRLSIHYFILQSLSLGGTLGFESGSGSNTYQDNPGTWTADVPTESRLVIAPRVGYALMFTDKVGIWFRGGIGYERMKRRLGEAGENYARDSLAVASADVFFIWSPVSHLGFLIGPTGDLSFVGRHFEHDPQNGDWSNDARLRRIGLTSGVVGYF
jgi:hypothetical protein